MSNTTIKYGGSDFITFFSSAASSGIRCPVPIVSIDSTANTDINNSLLSITSSIQLEGYIIAGNISGCLAGYSGIVNFFSDTNKQSKTFEIACTSTPIAIYSGVSFKSANAKPSENNWVITLPYSITLESVSTTGNNLIESYEDSWTIEPLEDISYYDFSKNSDLYDFKNTGSTANTQYPPSLTDMIATNKDIRIQNILQYRITHRLSAVGKAIDRTNTNNPAPGGGVNTNNLFSQAYAEAAKWVLEKSKDSYRPFSSTQTREDGISLNKNTAVATQTSGLNLYNHMRTIESNISAGSYGITDTWLGLGTGIKFVEDFTFEVNTDNFIQTVTLQGTIKGLEEANITNNNTYVVFPSSIMTGLIGQNFVTNFAAQNNINNKFINAVSGYISGVKPYLYERASLVLSSMNRPPDSVRTDRAGRPLQIIQPSVYGRLNITPFNYNESLNPNAGTVGYSITYNNKPGSWVSGALSSTLNITENNQTDIVAETFVLGRPLGPILERVGYSKSERRVSLEVVYPIPTGYNESHPNSTQCIINKNRPEFQQIDQLMSSFRPIAPVAFATLVPTSSYGVANQGQVFKTSESQTWNPFEGRFSWDITWIYNTGLC